MTIRINKQDNTPLYRQICQQVRQLIRDGQLQPGQLLPSLNQLAIMLAISRETTKKAYNQLLREGLLIAQQGKGIFVAGRRETDKKEILLILDKQSVYNQILVQAFQDTLQDSVHITILLHSQNLDVLDYYLNQHLDRYDYYVISPHFPLDARSQARAAKLLRRIPNRKLIMVDNWIQDVPGNYGVVYQDFRQDAYAGLSEGKADIGKRIKVMVLPQSLYGQIILESVYDFARENGVEVSVSGTVPEHLEKGDVVLVLNSQLDSGLALLARRIGELGLQPGRDVRIIAYNEFPLNEVVLGGLTTLSTDFPAMGRTAAEMVRSGILHKVHNPFHLVRRSTF